MALPAPAIAPPVVSFPATVVVGSRESADTLRVREFLSRNGVQHEYRDLGDRGAAGALARMKVRREEIPAVSVGKKIEKNPSNERLADLLGLAPRISTDEVYDLLVVGAGPAGLAATVNGASEGLRVLSLEAYAPGGQAGTSSRIENFLGFPQGLSGEQLAQLARSQAHKFGATQVVAREATRIQVEDDGRTYAVTLADGARAWAHAVILATGGRYKKPPIANIDRFTGQGVYYAATHIEAALTRGQDVVVVGAGNSAGQAAMYLSTIARRVYMLVRGTGLEDTMSFYLVSRIRETKNIEVLTSTQIVALAGDAHLETVSWQGPRGRTDLKIRHVFLMIGSDPSTAWLDCAPNSGWLAGCVELDDKGFVRTTGSFLLEGKTPEHVKNEERFTRDFEQRAGRRPSPYETSLPRVFAVGDVRSQSVKRVASAVGEGSVAIHYVYRALAQIGVK